MFREDRPVKHKQEIETLNARFSQSDPKEVLQFVLNEYGNKTAFSSSMGAEDQVITSILASLDNEARIITLDTGRLFPETYDLIQKTNSRYKINIEIMFPDAPQVEEMVKDNGINLFYDSIEKRKLCCNIRKIQPLKRALTGLEAWITGLRKEQSANRAQNSLFEWDEAHDIMKVNPLINWSEDEVREYIRRNSIPYNPLHDKGFKSIGCLPCTRAVEPGEDSRAGRWYWENQGHKECGLHMK